MQIQFSIQANNKLKNLKTEGKKIQNMQNLPCEKKRKRKRKSAFRMNHSRKGEIIRRF